MFDLWKMLSEKLKDLPLSYALKENMSVCWNLNFPVMVSVVRPSTGMRGVSRKLCLRRFCETVQVLLPAQRPAPLPPKRPPFLTSSRMDGFPMRARAVDSFLLVP